jgi:hypothetical protein
MRRWPNRNGAIRGEFDRSVLLKPKQEGHVYPKLALDTEMHC